MRETVFVRYGKGKRSKEINFVLFTHFLDSLCTSQWPPQFPEVGAIHSLRLNEEEWKIPLIPQTSDQPYPQLTISTSDVMTTVLLATHPFPLHMLMLILNQWHLQGWAGKGCVGTVPLPLL